VDDGIAWPSSMKFNPATVPISARIEPYEVDRHWTRIGYFLKTEDGHLIVDGIGIRSHLILAQVYWFLLASRVWDEAAFEAFNATIAHGGIWPPVLILMASRTYPNHIESDDLREIIHRFAPNGNLGFSTDAIYFDFGRLSERLEREVRRVQDE